MVKIAILDDYQGVALASAPWGGLPTDTQLQVYHDHLSDVSALADRLEASDIICAMWERTPFPRHLLEQLPR